jgi:hypothetical protein
MLVARLPLRTALGIGAPPAHDAIRASVMRRLI